jgi:GT2 family glycosyltransferase
MALALRNNQSMNSATQSSKMPFFHRRDKHHGIIHRLRAILWKLGIALDKKYLRFQDWSGLYNYQKWISDQEKISVTTPSGAPEVCISIIIRVNKLNLPYLKNTYDSLINQTHQNWEALVLFDQFDVGEDFLAFFKTETRFHLNQSMSTGWKDSLRKCRGDWVEYLNSGDMLDKHALAAITSWIIEYPSASLIYSDSDRLSDQGLVRHTPAFWPDWSPELLLSVNYLIPAFFRRKELLGASVEAKNLEEAILRLSEKAEWIIHIPMVLCHLKDGQQDPWLNESIQPENLTAHLQRCGLADLTSRASSSTGVRQFFWSVRKNLVSIIILSHDNVKLLKRCIDSILSKTAYPDFEIILVENNSQDPDSFAYYEQIRSHPRVRFVEHNLPFNYSAFNNWAVRQSNGELLLFLNNDIECLTVDWLDEMVRWASWTEIGAVGAKLLYPDHRIQHSGLIVGLEGHANHIFAGAREGYSGLFGSVDWYRDYSAVTGACLMMRKAVFDQIGGFDENYSLAFNDVGLCLRLRRAGYRVVYTPFASLIHHESSTRGGYIPYQDMLLAYEHFKENIEQGDPFFNPNLSYSVHIPTFKRPLEMPPLNRLEKILRYSN